VIICSVRIFAYKRLVLERNLPMVLINRSMVRCQGPQSLPCRP